MTVMRAVLYSEDRLGQYYFAPDCTVSLTAGQMTLYVMSGSKPLTIAGKDHLLGILYENLNAGVEETVLRSLLSLLSKEDLFSKMKEAHFIE